MTDLRDEPLRCSICQSTEHLAYQHDAHLAYEADREGRE